MRDQKFEEDILETAVAISPNLLRWTE